MISPFPARRRRPGTATRPFPGIMLDVVTRKAEPVPPNEGGYLVDKQPWPSMLRTILGRRRAIQAAVLVRDTGGLFRRRRRTE